MTTEEKAFTLSPAGEIPVITMIFTGEEIKFLLAGNGKAFIDWGDGERESITLEDSVLGDFYSDDDFELKHLYKESAEAALVTIRGNVTALDCRNVNVIALDLSRAASLMYLDCAAAGITSLDLLGASALQILSCSNTGITALDISKNTVLKDLYCSNTGIVSLDMSANPALRVLFCHNTRVTGLDVSGNPALLVLSCSNTGITALNVSGNPALLELDCSGNDITEIDIRGNSALRELKCAFTRVTSLDTGGNSALEFLECNDTDMDADTLDALFRSLPDRSGKEAGDLACGNTPGFARAGISIARNKNWTVK